MFQTYARQQKGIRKNKQSENIKACEISSQVWRLGKKEKKEFDKRVTKEGE